MPYIIHGNTGPREASADIVAKDFEYAYPEGLDLKPGSKLHEDLKTKIFQRANQSHLQISKRYDAWRETDRILTVYKELTGKEEDIITDDPTKPVSIVFPYSYAIMETLLTYLMMAFFQDPIFRYEGSSPEDTVGAILMEMVINHNCIANKVQLPLYVQFRDALAYGIGPVSPGWTVRRGSRIRKAEGGILGLFKSLGNRKAIEEDVILYEGNDLTNIDPYRYLPDPNVSAHKVQEGEFVGWVERSNIMNLLIAEKESAGDIFNTKYVKMMGDKKSTLFGTESSDRQKKTGGPTYDYSTVTNPADTIHMYVTMIPKDWKIGDGEYPEKWLFSLTSDSIITRAQSLGLVHNLYPVSVCAPEFDGYSSAPLSRMEMIFGLQGVLDWLFNSHIANVRKAINDMLVVDPYLINMKDLRDPKPGKLIRLRRPAWGKSGAKDAVHQLKVEDITRAHMGDIGVIVQSMNKIMGVDDPAMGSLRKGGPERLTKSEFQGTQFGAVSRLEKLAKIIGLQSMQDIGYMFASQTQQLMEEETYMNAVGRWPEDLLKEYGIKVKDGRVKVSPFDVLIDYDLIVRDGSIPGGNFSEAWIKLFKDIISVPELYKTFDIPKIFMHIARNLKAKNVNEFIRTKTVPDEEVDQEVDKGNIIPLGVPNA
ncbi:hypothetical protein KAR91_34485 [Candidatus Pacearchaeota archaeon]|nr:hypothetical protein [Candidatus Pacearchaeota archaeon]